MISFEEAYDMVLGKAISMPPVRVDLNDSMNRILAEDILSDMYMPPFDKSAVDGYACRLADIDAPLEVIEVIAAGKVPLMKIRKGTCAKIMTGAMIPEGADTVLMVEDIECLSDRMVRFMKDETGKNICYLGEDMKKGEKLLVKGSRIQPQHIAVMAAVGAANPLVSAQPRVGILSTGDELVEPDQKPGPSQIRNSNAWQLIAQVRKASAIPEYLGIAQDDPVSLQHFLSASFEKSDVILITGGVSMGDYDLVPEILEKADVKILFKSVAIQPGRPTVFGIKGSQFIFGLPGNPVSSFVIFEILIKPFLLKMMGYTGTPYRVFLPMGLDFIRKKASRKSFVPVKITDGELFPIEYHGSAHINAYVEADGIIALERGETLIKKGERVHVRQL